MNLEKVFGESLQHYGIKRNVPLTNRTGSTMNVNFEVTDTKLAFLSVHKGCGNGSMIVFTPDGDVNDGVCVNDERRKFESDSRMSIHSSDRDCNAKRLERELGAWRTSEYDDSGPVSGI